MMSDPRKKNRPNQPRTGLLLLTACVIIGVFFAFRSPLHAFYWFSGLGFGYVLQKSRFCFTAGFRDPHLLGSTIITQSVLIALGLTTIGFTIIKYAYVLLSLPIPGMDYIHPIGIYTLLGGILFGVGMVVAGGCASGVLMRVGDGFLIQMVVLLFFVIGSLLGVRDLPWWKSGFSLVENGIFLPDLFGWPLALGIQLFVLALLYRFAKNWEEKKMNE
ncbi:YeeE/YedE family protein [Alkalibacter rhizosphaerae]|uniref:YeeE/YedE family protein n=1 Tax=Alkalibacter rhizosphaerae TaxID=2815577 RepID=A0A975AIS1_9FIRM|nr:YeeE/YedE thiosulfate transporter family protein [Alkalibacter rhizosphaerae]QSX09398.1 YeeE/YedE family protein [Alkalibacter rhizosphaerae]